MPTTNNRNLTLTTVDENVTVRVRYNAVFTPFERFLAANGMKFREQIAVMGMDAPGPFTGNVLANFTAEYLLVTAGPGVQTIPRDRSKIVTRASLQEDPALGDNDEIRCRITITPIGMPVSITEYTDQEVLIG